MAYHTDAWEQDCRGFTFPNWHTWSMNEELDKNEFEVKCLEKIGKRMWLHDYHVKKLAWR